MVTAWVRYGSMDWVCIWSSRRRLTGARQTKSAQADTFCTRAFLSSFFSSLFLFLGSIWCYPVDLAPPERLGAVPDLRRCGHGHLDPVYSHGRHRPAVALYGPVHLRKVLGTLSSSASSLFQCRGQTTIIFTMSTTGPCRSSRSSADLLSVGITLDCSRERLTLSLVLLHCDSALTITF